MGANRIGLEILHTCDHSSAVWEIQTWAKIRAERKRAEWHPVTDSRPDSWELAVSPGTYTLNYA